MLFRYSRWDGSQDVPDPDADDLLEAMSDDIMSDGDVWSALRRLFQQGAQTQRGPRMPGLQDLVNQLRKRRQQELQRALRDELRGRGWEVRDGPSGPELVPVP